MLLRAFRLAGTNVTGAIEAKRLSLGQAMSVLGNPVGDEAATPNGVGRFRHFQNGSIYWTNQTGTHVSVRAIQDKWASMDWEGSALGYQMTHVQVASTA